MDTNLMIVWLFGIAVGGIVIFLVAQKIVIKRGSDGFSVEFERKVDQIQIQLEQIKSSHEERMKDYEAKLTKIKSMVDIEKEKTKREKEKEITKREIAKINILIGNEDQIIVKTYELDIDYNNGISLTDEQLYKNFININSHISKNETIDLKVNLNNRKIYDWQIENLDKTIKDLEKKGDNRTVEEEAAFIDLKRYLEKLNIYKEKFSYCIKSFFLLSNTLGKYYNPETIRSIVKYLIMIQDSYIKSNDECSIDCYNIDFRKFNFKVYIPYSDLGKKGFPKMADLQDLPFEAMSMPENYIYENIIPGLIFKIYNQFHRNMQKMPIGTTEKELKEEQEFLQKKFLEEKGKGVFDLSLFYLGLS